jgi:hypothetical protein
LLIYTTQDKSSHLSKKKAPAKKRQWPAMISTQLTIAPRRSFGVAKDASPEFVVRGMQYKQTAEHEHYARQWHRSDVCHYPLRPISALPSESATVPVGGLEENQIGR